MPNTGLLIVWSLDGAITGVRFCGEVYVFILMGLFTLASLHRTKLNDKLLKAKGYGFFSYYCHNLKFEMN